VVLALGFVLALPLYYSLRVFLSIEHVSRRRCIPDQHCPQTTFLLLPDGWNYSVPRKISPDGTRIGELLLIFISLIGLVYLLFCPH
jgi:hypothetical protein